MTNKITRKIMFHWSGCIVFHGFRTWVSFLVQILLDDLSIFSISQIFLRTTCLVWKLLILNQDGACYEDWLNQNQMNFWLGIYLAGSLKKFLSQCQFLVCEV